MIMKKQKQLFVLFITMVMTACHNENAEQKKCYASYELVGTEEDTVNLLDCDKRKQGIWIPNVTNDLKDTLLYRNDTVIGHLH